MLSDLGRVLGLDHHKPQKGLDSTKPPTRGKVTTAMRKLQVIGLALVSVFAFCAFAASSASAHEWLVNGAAVPAGGVTVDSEGTLLLEDMSGLAKEAAVVCLGTGLGLVLPAGKDEQNSITVGTCRVEKPCATFEKAAAVNLPWTTELLEPVAGGGHTDAILTGTGGNPGWLVECNEGGIIGKVDDTCTTTKGEPLANNENGNVDIEFMANGPKSEFANCTIGGAEVGLVEGLVTLEALQNGAKVTLEVS